ncbi:MAG: class B sortase [Oscillospiraceae bacterium]|nr:class B sortase [Oscillospiraceae bacterium]
MNIAAKAGKKTIRLVNGIVDTAVMIMVFLLIAVGFYAIWDSKQVYQAANSVRYEAYKPTEENEGASFEELRAVNPDVFSWLEVYGTNINYPVVQGGDNMRYVNTNAEGKYSLSGAIFLDYRCSRDFSDFSSILYGHHMEKSAMFGEIGNFSDKGYFEERRYGTLYYGGEEHGLEFFAFLHTDAYDDTVFKTNITKKEARQAYLDRIFELALHTREIGITADDHIVLLSTCSSVSTNGRDILVGKLTDDIHGDFFEKDEPGDKVTLAVDKLADFWTQIPIWIKVVAIIIPFMLLILLLSLIANNKKRYKKQKKSAHDILRKGG